MNVLFAPRQVKAYNQAIRSWVLDAWLLWSHDKTGLGKEAGVLLLPKGSFTEAPGGMLCISAREPGAHEWPLDQLMPTVTLDLPEGFMASWGEGIPVDIDARGPEPRGRTLLMQLCEGVSSEVDGQYDIQALLAQLLVRGLEASLDACDATGRPALAYAQHFRDTTPMDAPRRAIDELIDEHVLTQMLEGMPTLEHASRRPRL